LYGYYFDQFIYAIARMDRIIHLLKIKHELTDLMIKNILTLHALYTLLKRSLHKGMNNGIYEFLK